MDWYEGYDQRHRDDLDEGRLVSLFRFEESWTSWEMHPAARKCLLPSGSHDSAPGAARRKQAGHELGPGEYAINPRGAWHTADAEEPVVALFITAGKDTTHRPR